MREGFYTEIEKKKVAGNRGEPMREMMESVAMREKWEVHYSRFLNFPSKETTEAVTVACPHLKVRRNTKSSKENGTWLTASSSAELKLIFDLYNVDVIMRVHYRGRIMEEHFISKLNISWPQVSCESGFPPRGTRVLTVTYRDEMEEVQKFAFRFSTICNLEAFLNALKVYMEDARRTLHINCDNRSDVSSPQIYRPRMDFDSRTPLKSLSPQLPFLPNSEIELSPCPQGCGSSSRELASSSDFNKKSSTSENFYQQAVVEVLRADSFQKLQTLKPVGRKIKKGSDDSSLSTLKSQHHTTTAGIVAVTGHNRELYATKKGKENTNPQSKMLISVEESTHNGKKATESRTDQQGISEHLSKPIRWHRSSETVTEDNSHYRTPTMSNQETDEASNPENPVPSGSITELEQGQHHQDSSNYYKLDSLETFPPSFTALLSSCFSSTEQAAAPQTEKLVKDELKFQIARYMEDSSFQEMLMKVEKVINELGYVDALEG
ncbi:hypothetical protein QQ045_016732 [Rhodiola kirilowii]